MKLRKCFCGKKPKMFKERDELRYVYCECGLESLQWHSGNLAASNWNLIINDKKCKYYFSIIKRKRT